MDVLYILEKQTPSESIQKANDGWFRLQVVVLLLYLPYVFLFFVFSVFSSPTKDSWGREGMKL